MDEKPASLSDGVDKQAEITGKQQRRMGAENDANVFDAPTPSTSTRKRGIGAVTLSNTNPGDCSQDGLGGSQQEESGESLRLIHRRRLWLLAEKLFLQHNWSEANGVFSVLLKATTKDTSALRNRFKYWATLLLMRRIKGGAFTQRKIQNIFDLWMKSLGAIEKQPSRLAVLMEFVLYCLRHGNIEDARQNALCLMQERGFQSNPLANFVVGLTFYEVWYSAIPEDMQLKELNESSSPSQSPISVGSYMSVEETEGHEAVEAQVRNFPIECDSNSSIGNEKTDFIVSDGRREIFMQVDSMEQKTPGSGFQAQAFHINPSESSGHEGFSFANHSDDIPANSIFYTRGLPPWMLPLKLPDSTEDLENFIYRHRNLLNDAYRNAVNYFRTALYSEPPLFEAFHPLIQILLLGDQVDEALNEAEKFSQNLETALHLRLKTCLLEYFDQSNFVKLSTCFEDILEKDPACSHSLVKLLSMHQRGDYSTERLVEMIALHLDATFADWNTWQELAACLFKLSQHKEDEMSTCLDKYENEKHQLKLHSNQIPAIFTNPEPKSNWRFRCKWWLSRHFSKKNFQSDIISGEMQLVTYKAVAGTHLYGRELNYVAEAYKYLDRENKSEMLSILRMHINNSVGFYFNLNGRKS